MSETFVRLDELNFKSLAEANDGEYDAMLRHMLREVVTSCKQLPTLEKARKLTVTIEATPVADMLPSGTVNLTSIDAAISIKVATPTVPLRAMSLGVRQDAQGRDIAALATYHADDRNQSTISDMLEDGTEVTITQNTNEGEQHDAGKSASEGDKLPDDDDPPPRVLEKSER